MEQENGKGCFMVLLISFFIIAGIAVFVFLYFSFREKHDFDLENISRASINQVEQLQKAIVSGKIADKNKVFTYPGPKNGDYDFIGTRMVKANQDTTIAVWVIYDEKEAPGNIEWVYQGNEFTSSSEFAKHVSHTGVKVSLRSPYKHVHRYLLYHFDDPGKRPNGLFWRMSGLGKDASIKE